jgi:hypothetical protein
MEMRGASVVCTSRHQAKVHADISIAHAVFSIAAAISPSDGGNVF